KGSAALRRQGRRAHRASIERRRGARHADHVGARGRAQSGDRVAARQAENPARARVLRGCELRRDRIRARHHSQPRRRADPAREAGAAAEDARALRRRVEMTCPEELEWSMYVDEALTAAETARLAQHLASCSACRARVDALGVEAEALRAALADEEREVAIPAFRKTPRQRGPLGAAAVLIGLATSSLAVADVLRALGWAESLAALNPFTRSDAIDFLFGTLVFIATEGRSMLTSTIETAGAAVVVALLVAAALAALRKGRGAAVLSAALAAIAFSQQSGALEVRRSEGGVSVAAGETIDDTLIAMGREVEINGRVTGDLIALGQRVVIRGSVDGQLVTGARHVEIEGTLGGSVLGAAETV